MPHPTAGEELTQLRASTARDPGHFISWVMLSEAELDAGNLAAGLAAAEAALRLEPGHPEALARQGKAFWLLGRHREAAAALREAARRAPAHPGIALWLGHALEDAGEAEQAAAAYEHAYRLVPGQAFFAAYLLNWRRKIADWRELDALSAQVRGAVARGEPGVEPFAFLSEDAAPAEQLACARIRAAALATPSRPRAAGHWRGPGHPLRLGFLSNGFGAHPTGLLTVALFERLQHHAGVEIELFALNPDDRSSVGRRLRAAARLHEVAGLPHREIALRIAARGLHVLFDLRGWGGGGAPEVLALRPVPVQVNWLAYPGTSGAPWIDYVIGDGFALPPQLAKAYSETVARLPRCFQPSDDTRLVGTPPPRAECGLPTGGVVFCCFNNSYKLNPSSFARMMAVLHEVPDSVLWLLAGPGRANERLAAAAAAAGIAPSRLVFMEKLPHAEYLARYRHVDLFLDTTPYNAHTTASDAQWAGCPVLTRPGETFASRVAGSLNHHLGLDSMNVDSDRAFIERAVALAQDPRQLAQVRKALQEARVGSGVFDMDAFSHDFLVLVRQLAQPHGGAGGHSAMAASSLSP